MACRAMASATIAIIWHNNHLHFYTIKLILKPYYLNIKKGTGV